VLLPFAAFACCAPPAGTGDNGLARLVSAFVLSQLDYCNALLAELPASTLAPLQRVMPAAARLVCGPSPRDHATPALESLHWLPVKQRIEFKLCLLVHQTINGRAPVYLNDLIETTASVYTWPSFEPLCRQQ